MKIIFLFIIFQLVIVSAYSQTPVARDTLVGLIVNSKGKRIKNVPVYAKGQSKPVRTNRKGLFVLTGVNLPDSITVILPPKRIFQVPVDGKKFIKIKTGTNAFHISEAKKEIVNIGYGMKKKSTMTSGTFTVSGKELLATGESDLVHALAGKVPGLNLNYNEDGTVTLQIRGGTTLTGDNEPLYVVDGVIVDDLDMVNLNDIARVDVLKDGSIYGTRGANGAIVVTTNK